MWTRQNEWSRASGWLPGALEPAPECQLVLLFAGKDVLASGDGLDDVRRAYPSAHVIGCSTAGEIRDVNVSDDTLVVTAVCFERSRVRAAGVDLGAVADSRQAGAELARALAGDELVHVFVLSDGLGVNGSELVAGLAAELPAHVTTSGGLSGDGDRFEETLVLLDEPRARSGLVAAVGLYGSSLRVGCASLGGWDPFGPERVVTRSEGNVLHELDGRSALGLYREYLGEHAADLPASGLLFPLTVRTPDHDVPVVRTVLAIDDENQTMTFAGDLPEGAYARLMKANFDRLIDGAGEAARTSSEALADHQPDLAILISCVGRKMVLKQRVEEELEAVRSVVGPYATLAGFYSYGEISPFTPNARCELHNQTMTITAISEL